MVEGKTKSGIKFSVDENIKEDMDIMLLLAEVQDPKTSAEEKMIALKDILWLVFGSREAVFAFTSAVNKIHGNRKADTITSELSEIFDAINAKNS